MAQYTYNKLINPARLTSEIVAAGLTTISHIDTSGSIVLVYFNTDLTTNQKTTLDGVVAAHAITIPYEVIAGIIENAIGFGITLQKDFVTQNVMLGITQRSLTNHVRKTLREVKDAIETGSLYDAITEVKLLNPADFDDVILTPARLLVFRNAIETYLNVPLASAWNDDETWL